MPAATRAKVPPAVKRPSSSFLTDDQTEAVAHDVAANDAYVQLSKLDEGKTHRFRFVGPAITGYSTWIETDGKSRPLRWRQKPEDDEIPGNLQINKRSGKPAEIKRFVCGFVWDYQKERISVLFIDQKTLLQELHSNIVDPDFGDPQEYDIKIVRKLESDFTKYKLTAAPPKTTNVEIMEAYDALMDKGADLNVMFDNGNPFDPEASKASDDEDEDDEEDLDEDGEEEGEEEE